MSLAMTSLLTLLTLADLLMRTASCGQAGGEFNVSSVDFISNSRCLTHVDC